MKVQEICQKICDDITFYESTAKAFYGGDDTKPDCKFPKHDKRSSTKASLSKGKCRHSDYFSVGGTIVREECGRFKKRRRGMH